MEQKTNFLGLLGLLAAVVSAWAGVWVVPEIREFLALDDRQKPGPSQHSSPGMVLVSQNRSAETFTETIEIAGCPGSRTRNEFTCIPGGTADGSTFLDHLLPADKVATARQLQSLRLPDPADGRIARYRLTITYQALEGDLRVTTANGRSQSVPYRYRYTCSLEATLEENLSCIQPVEGSISPRPEKKGARLRALLMSSKWRATHLFAFGIIWEFREDGSIVVKGGMNQRYRVIDDNTVIVYVKEPAPSGWPFIHTVVFSDQNQKMTLVKSPGGDSHFEAVK